MAEKRDAQKGIGEERGIPEKDLSSQVTRKEDEPLMGISEFGQTAHVSAVLLAGYRRYCELTNASKRQTRTAWQAGLNAWAARAAG